MRALHAPSEKPLTADLPSANPITFPCRSVTAGTLSILPSLQPSRSVSPRTPRLVSSVYAVPLGLSNLKFQISNPQCSLATLALLPSHALPVFCLALLAKRCVSFVALASGCQPHFAFCTLSFAQPLTPRFSEVAQRPWNISFPQPFQRFSFHSNPCRLTNNSYSSLKPLLL